MKKVLFVVLCIFLCGNISVADDAMPQQWGEFSQNDSVKVQTSKSSRGYSNSENSNANYTRQRNVQVDDNFSKCSNLSGNEAEECMRQVREAEMIKSTSFPSY